MIKLLILAIATVTFVPVTFASDVRIAFSNSENIEVFAKNPDSNGQWCTDNVEVKLKSTNPEVDYSTTAVDQMIAKVGSAVIEKSCPTATQITIYQGDTNTLIGAAMKNGQWAVIREGANESDPPTEEDAQPESAASSEPSLSTTAQDAPIAQETAANTPAPIPQPAPAPAPASKSSPAIKTPIADKSLVQSELDEAKSSGKRDLPLTKENMELFAGYFKKRADRYEMKLGENETEISVKLAKAVIEEDMGFSFDLSLRRVFLFENIGLETIAGQIFSESYRYIATNPDNLEKALKNSYVSRRTYEVIRSLLTSKRPLPEHIEFLGFIQECQDGNAGICNTKNLLGILKARGVIATEIPSDSTMDRRNLNRAIFEKYKLDNALREGGWLLTAQGEEFNPAVILDYDHYRYKINVTALDRSINNLKIYEEESEFFRKISGI